MASTGSENTLRDFNILATENKDEYQTGDQDNDTQKSFFNTDSSPDQREGHSSDIVDWDGPDDPENPMNWSTAKKATAVSIVSLITFITPLASSIFAPSIEQVMAEFHSDNEQLAAFIVSVYLLGYCFGPLLIAPLSELYGRYWVYHICNIIFVIFTVACALAPNLSSLIIFRLLSGLAGSCPLTLGAGSLADMIAPEKRGAAMAAWILGPLVGPVVGPIGKKWCPAGGYLTQAKSWRWSFWVVAIAAGAVTILGAIFLRESYAYTLLEQKTKRLRKESGNPNLRSKLDTGRSPIDVFKLAIFRPSKMLLFSPIVFLLSLYMAILYGYLYLLFTAMSAVFEGPYGFSTGQVGLSYLGFGIGNGIGLAFIAATSDRMALSLQAKHGGELKPEYRLPLMTIASFFVPVGLFWFGWTAETHQHWILPIVGTTVLGFGLVLTFMAISVYLVDAFGTYAASAMAANTVLRSLLGALLPLAGRSMFDALGLGWGSSLLAFIAVAMIPLPIIFLRHGERIRNIVLFNVKF
ncbi:multidrug resistant [Trichoderma arundinaceum]|uniref:Multidrug resistant n=1 Tax=Trichoderma arundinaceum TaxID=490622 RepID=A0A395NVH5_TRIAR|nr:multidrug resistant [Trichoderma arundinaceum]